MKSKNSFKISQYACAVLLIVSSIALVAYQVVHISGFRFFSSGWCFCEKIIGETFAISNIICTFVAIRTDIKV